VPAIHQHKVLLFGILAALVLRGLFIAAGAAVIEQFEWVFYLFGAFLLYTGWRLAFRRDNDEEEEFRENATLRLIRRFLPVTDDYHGAAVFTRIDGKRFVTPMLVVMLAIGTTDILFALDSIPAIFGLTKEPFLVFASNAFALMGLRQLYFLLGGLLNRLIYLDIGLAVILAFIGVKLILEALHGEGVSWAPEIGIVTSLTVIVVVLGVTTALSLLKVRRDPSAAKHLPTTPTPRPRSTPEPTPTSSPDERSDRAATTVGDTGTRSTAPGAPDAAADLDEPEVRPGRSPHRGQPVARPPEPARPGSADHPPPRRSSGGGAPARPLERGRPAPATTRSDLPAEGH
jgi:tellurite resistance protein TerC